MVIMAVIILSIDDNLTQKRARARIVHSYCLHSAYVLLTGKKIKASINIQYLL